MSNPTLIYDGDCGVCERLATWVRHRTRGERLDVVPFQVIDPSVLAPELTVEACMRAVQFVSTEGLSVSGARAVFASLCLLPPPWRWVGRCCLPVSPLFEPFYRLVARHRLRISQWLGLDACRLSIGSAQGNDE